MLPKIVNYGHYSNENSGVNSLKVDFGDWEIYYSYETIVAFCDLKGIVCCENAWGVTTGKHLNWIMSDKKRRVKKEEFDDLLEKFLETHTR